MDAVTLLLAALATYRLARMVATEEGPFGVFVALRGRLDPDQRTWIGRGLNCPLCVGFWAAPLALGLLWLWPPLAWWLGCAGAATLLQKWEHRR